MTCLLKTFLNKVEVGTTFSIRNSWRKAISNALGRDEEGYPFLFSVVDTEVDPDTKRTNYICESVKGECDRKQKIIVSASVIEYSNAQEVSDINVGLYFDDYFPEENKKLLVYDRKSDTIHPVKMIFSVEVMPKKIAKVDFSFQDLLTFKSESIGGYLKMSWKLLDGPEDYMSNTEKMYKDTFVHRGYVSMVCDMFAKHLDEEGFNSDAEELRARAIVHDNSKIVNIDEFRALTSIINDKSSMKDANSKLSAYKQDSIELHWKHNRHHPEHFENVEDMTRIDRMEMVCDWYARAKQYGTDFLDFVQKRQEDRFHFPEAMFDEIFHYCKIVKRLDEENK